MISKRLDSYAVNNLAAFGGAKQFGAEGFFARFNGFSQLNLGRLPVILSRQILNVRNLRKTSL